MRLSPLELFDNGKLMDELRAKVAPMGYRKASDQIGITISSLSNLLRKHPDGREPCPDVRTLMLVLRWLHGDDHPLAGYDRALTGSEHVRTGTGPTVVRGHTMPYAGGRP